MNPLTSPTWTCTRCRMTVRFAPGFEAPEIPNGWQRDGDDLRCLGCCRTLRVDRAVAEARAAGDDRTVDQIKREALVAMELERDPTRSAGQIGSAIGYGAASVGVTIRKLRRAGLAAAQEAEGMPL
jgi:hypothetical protein